MTIHIEDHLESLIRDGLTGNLPTKTFYGVNIDEGKFKAICPAIAPRLNVVSLHHLSKVVDQEVEVGYYYQNNGGYLIRIPDEYLVALSIARNGALAVEIFLMDSFPDQHEVYNKPLWLVSNDNTCVHETVANYNKRFDLEGLAEDKLKIVELYTERVGEIFEKGRAAVEQLQQVPHGFGQTPASS